MANESPPLSVDQEPQTAAVPAMSTSRLRLRERSIDDAEALFEDMSDPAVMSWWSRAPFASVAELRANFAPSPSGWRTWAITRQGDDRAIGFVAAGEKRQGGVSEIGYLLARDAQGRGIAQEAVTAVIDRLFAEGQRRVFADCDPENRESIALLERLGFQLEGRLRAEWQTHMGTRDSLIYGLLTAEWRARTG
jgi:ribosomal-protein-alanine N-acetyltransferase